MSTQLFYSDYLPDQNEAKAICRGCPVQPDCLRYAIRTQQQFGVWGGTDPTERSRIAATPPKPQAGRG